MSNPDLVDLFVEPINRLNLNYMVTGAVAAILYGEPRLTNDIDIVATLGDTDVQALVAAFPTPEFYVPPREVIDVERTRDAHGHFNLIHTPTSLKADIYPAGKDPLAAWGLENRRAIGTERTRIWTAPPEYVILLKLQYWREGGSDKHLRDIRAIVRVLGEDLDRTRIATESAERGLSDLWQRALAALG